MAISDKLIADIRAQVAGVSQSISSMRSLLAGVQNTGNIGISMPMDVAINSASLKKTFDEMNNLIGNSGQKSMQLITGLSEKFKGFTENIALKDVLSSIKKEAKNINFSNLGTVFDSAKANEYLDKLKKVRNLNALSDKKDNIKSSIAQVSARVREKVSVASISAKEKMTDKIASFRETGTSALSGISAKVSDRASAFNSGGGEINIGEIISQLKPNDILNHLQAIESAIRGTRQHEKKVNA